MEDKIMEGYDESLKFNLKSKRGVSPFLFKLFTPLL